MKEDFSFVDNDVLNLLSAFLCQLKARPNLSKEELKFLERSLIDLDNHPLRPVHSIFVSLSHEDVSLYVVYSNYKVELCDYLNDGSESSQRFSFRYEASGYREYKGNIREFRELLLNSLRQSNDVSIKDED